MHPQLQQFLTLLTLLVLGKYSANIYLPWKYIVLVLVFAAIAEHAFIFMRNKRIDYLSYSALSTAMGVMLMMISSQLWIYLVVILFALLQKNFMRIADKHFFNPSNFALITALALFYNDAHIVLGQLGSEVWLALTVMAMAIAILVRVERWIVPIVFIATYLSFQYIFVVHHDPVLTMDDIYQRFYSVSFIVFVLFMLTDPATTPQSAKGQIGFVLIVSSLAVWMDRENGFRVQHLFMALFLISVFVPIAIQWQNKKKIRYLAVGTLFVLLLALSAIIYIEIQPPYYFEMDG